MPSSVKHSILIVFFALAIGGIDTVLQLIGITKQDTEIGSFDSFVIGLGINLFLLLLISKSNNIARWAFIVLTLIGFPLVYPTLLIELEQDIIGAVSTVIQLFLYSVAIILLLLKPSGEWFKNDTQES
jgi:hypothetical protein